jgi:hypothetical protein
MAYNRGDRVDYNGGKFRPVKNTYVWAVTQESLFKQYIIEHPDGYGKEEFMKDFLEGKSKKGIDGVHPNYLKYGLKYIFVYDEDLNLAK